MVIGRLVTELADKYNTCMHWCTHLQKEQNHFKGGGHLVLPSVDLFSGRPLVCPQEILLLLLLLLLLPRQPRQPRHPRHPCYILATPFYTVIHPFTCYTSVTPCYSPLYTVLPTSQPVTSPLHPVTSRYTLLRPIIHNCIGIFVSLLFSVLRHLHKILDFTVHELFRHVKCTCC